MLACHFGCPGLPGPGEVMCSWPDQLPPALLTADGIDSRPGLYCLPDERAAGSHKMPGAQCYPHKSAGRYVRSEEKVLPAELAGDPPGLKALDHLGAGAGQHLLRVADRAVMDAQPAHASAGEQADVPGPGRVPP